MPFYEVEGNDTRTHNPRTLRISARNDDDAIFTANQQGVSEVKLRPFSDREMLMMDLKCFLYADPMAPVKAKKQRLERQYPKSLLFDYPVLVITGSVLAALSLDRLIDYLVAML
jgi:hypothetical protein